MGEVVKEMCKEWKRGKSPNILPVLDFVILSILQKEGQKVPRNNEISDVSNF